MPSHGNKKTLAEFAVLLCLLQMVTYIHNVEAQYIFKVEIRSYSNPGNKRASGGCCDPFCGNCDPFYDVVCLRNRGHSHDDLSTCSLGSYTTRITRIPATATITSNNPWPVDFQLYIQVQDDDFNPDDLLDRLFIDHALNTSSQFSEVHLFQGDFQVVTLGLAFQVTCMTDYYGLDCGTFCQARSDSLGHYTCNPSTGARVCEPGYRDPTSNCIEPICMEGCHPVGGYCDSPGECLCQENWNGTLCDDLDSCLFSPCETGATCINLMGNNSYTCLCPPGFEGSNCGENINDCAPISPCMNGGTCIDLTADYSCNCLPGFTDKNCTTNIDECEGASCPGNSSCVDGVDSYECVCEPGFAGPNCDPDDTVPGFMDKNGTTNIDECEGASCPGNSSCMDGVDSYECVCDPGFAGPNCDPDDTGNTDSQGSDGNTVTIIGAVVGTLVVFIVILLFSIFLLKRKNQQKANFSVTNSAIRNGSSSDHNPAYPLSEIKSTSNIKELLADNSYVENRLKPTLHSPAADVTLHNLDNPLYDTGTADNPLYGENHSEPTPETLHKLDNPLHDSATADNPVIYTEPNPSYIPTSTWPEEKNGDLQPYAYARMFGNENKPIDDPDPTHQYDYVSMKI